MTKEELMENLRRCVITGSDFCICAKDVEVLLRVLEVLEALEALPPERLPHPVPGKAHAEEK